MRGSLKLFTWFGIPVYLHWTFGLIFLYIFWHANENGLSINETFWLTGLFMALFGCVLLHEYGHALAARRYGVRTRDIVLMPIGGMARLERMPEKPIQEFVVAIAGPMVNVMIAILLALSIWFFTAPEQLEMLRASALAEANGEPIEESGFEISLLLRYTITLLISNIVLVAFNLIPAFPMDGGRVLRALLSMRIGRPRATRIAAWIGQGFAVCFALFGAWNGNYMLAVLGLFVIYAARSENSIVQTEDVLSRFKARDLLRTQFTRLQSNDWMMNAIETLRHGLERHFLVFDLNGHLVGMLEEEDMLTAIKKTDMTAEVGKYMQKAEVVHLEESLQYVYYLIRQRGNGIVAVSDENGLAGVIDEAGLQYFLKGKS